MVDSNVTLTHTAEKDHAGVSMSWQLVVAVAVLGTVVGVAVVVACAWGCFVYFKQVGWTGKLRKQGSTQSFPPPHREAVEMAVLPSSSLTPTPQNQSVVVHTISGVSRGLGLGGSQVGEEPPAPPPPRSWTPSPPFNSTRAQNLPLKRTREQQSQTQYSRSGMATYISRGCNSPYNPRHNTLNTDLDSSSPSPPSSSPVYLPLVLRPLPGEPRPRYTTINPYWLELPPLQRPPHRLRRRQPRRCRELQRRYKGEDRTDHRSYYGWPGWPRSPHIYFKDTHKKNIISGGGEGSEVPAACSSHHGSPRRHPTLCQFPEPHTWGRRYLGPGGHYHEQNMTTSRPRGSRTHSPRPDTPALHRSRGVMVSLEGRARPGKQSDSHTTHHLPLPTPHSSKSSRQTSRCLGASVTAPRLLSPPTALPRTNPPQPSRPHLPAPLLPSSPPGDTERERDREVGRRLARKYGFCESCGRDKSHKKRMLSRREKKSRSTQTVCGDPSTISSSPDDPTPSLSWDNLTPDPSLALTHTRGEEEQEVEKGEEEKEHEELGEEEQEVGEGDGNGDGSYGNCDDSGNDDGVDTSSLPPWAESYGLTYRSDSDESDSNEQ